GVGTDNRMSVERERKLVPVDEALLDRLAEVEALGPLRVVSRRVEQQRNAFFDNAARAFAAAHVGFRRRVVDGQAMATWTIKGESAVVRGVTSRSEIELQLAPDMPPAMAIGALRQAAQSRGAPALAEAVGEALRVGGLPLAMPYLETTTERRILDLERKDAHVELALDRMAIVGHAYVELEIEAELKKGSEAVL